MHLPQFGGSENEVRFWRGNHGFLISRKEIPARTNPEFTECKQGAVISITFAC
jgi:hypothetical protein